MFGWFGRLIPEETLIEGIGNELLFVISLIGLCIFLILAWMSTGVNRDLLSIRITLAPQPGAGTGHEISSQNHPVSTSIDNLVSQAVNDGGELNVHSDESSLDELQDERSDTDPVLNGNDGESNITNVSLVRLKNGTPEEQRAYASRFRIKGHLVLRLQYLNDRTRYVHASPEMLISKFKRKHFAEELTEQSKNVRLIFQGHELVEQRVSQSGRTNVPPSDDSTISHQLRLCDYNVHDGATIHCLVTALVRPTNLSPDAPSQTSSRSHDSPTDPLLTEFDMGARLLEPLFAFLLAFSWFFRIAYRQYFNSVSTFALITLSVFFCGAVFTMNFVNAASAVSAFAARRRNRPNAGRTSTSEVRGINTSESGDVNVLTLVMANRRIRPQREQRGSAIPTTEATETFVNPSDNPSNA